MNYVTGACTKMANYYAYLRVSTKKQTIENQKLAVMDWAMKRGIPLPAENIYYDEAISGGISPKDRPGFKALWEKLQPGDYLIVPELSRLGRSLRDIVVIVDELKKKDIKLIAIKEGLDPDTNKMFYNIALAIFGALAETERELIRERTREGLARARAEGKQLGRPRKVDDAKILTLLRRGLKPREIADVLGVSRNTVYSAIKRLKKAGLIEKKEYYVVKGGV